MNSTLWNTTEEAAMHFILGAVTIFVHAYAIFLCYAVYDYQDEKPNDEKSPIDVLMKDLKNLKFWVIDFVLLCGFLQRQDSKLS